MAWTKVVIPSNDIALVEQSAFISQIAAAAREHGLVEVQLCRAALPDGGFEFFLEEPLPPLLEDTGFRGVSSAAPPRQAELIRL